LWLARETADQRFERELVTAWEACSDSIAQHDAPSEAAKIAGLKALADAGPGALPNLVEWIGPIPQKPRTREWLESLRNHWPFDRWGAFARWVDGIGVDPEVRCAAALWAFQILGTNASPAIPELTLAAKHPPDSHARWRAQRALISVRAGDPWQDFWLGTPKIQQPSARRAPR
jgi:hypothetical protein